MSNLILFRYNREWIYGMCHRDNNTTKELITAEGQQWVLNTSEKYCSLRRASTGPWYKNLKMDVIITSSHINETKIKDKHTRLNVWYLKLNINLEDQKRLCRTPRWFGVLTWFSRTEFITQISFCWSCFVYFVLWICFSLYSLFCSIKTEVRFTEFN